MNKGKSNLIIGIIVIIIVALVVGVPFVTKKAGVKIDFKEKKVITFKDKTTKEQKTETTTTTTTVVPTTTVPTTKAVENDVEKLNVYVFYGDGCPHCSALHAYFDDLETKDIGKKINIHYYEVWKNEDNQRLLQTVAKELKTEVGGVPFFVIGDKYYEGYSEAMNSVILSALNNPKSYEYDVMNAID